MSRLNKAVSSTVASRRPLNMLVTGISGSGKSTAMWRAVKELMEMTGQDKVLYIDTEAHRSGFSFAEVFPNGAPESVMTLSWEPPYDIIELRETLAEAEREGIETVAVDTLSAFWLGKGGAQDLNKQLAQTKYSKNTYYAWRDTGEAWQEILNMVTQSGMNFVVAAREKPSYVETKENGRTTYKKAGTGVQLRNDDDYEFDLEIQLVQSGGSYAATINKSRVNTLPPGTTYMGGMTEVNTKKILSEFAGFMSEFVESRLDDAKPSKDVQTPKWTEALFLDKIADLIPDVDARGEVFLAELGNREWEKVRTDPAFLAGLYAAMEEHVAQGEGMEEPEDEEPLFPVDDQELAD